MNDYRASRLNKIIENTKNDIVFYESDMMNQMYNTANFTSTGKRTKAADWSIRGHLAELHHQYSFKINSIAKLINQNRYGVATDKVGLGIPRVGKNNPLIDIQIYDKDTNDYYNYQSKVCNTKEASMAAATAKKYLDNNVIPLVPEGHSSVYDKINIGDVSSDPISKEKLDVLTSNYRHGIVKSHIADKRPEIFINSLKHSSLIAVSSALQTQLINLVLNEIFKDSDEKNISDYVFSFVKDSINNFIYSSVGVGLTLFTNNSTFISMFLSTLRKSIANLKQFVDGKISFNSFVLNVGLGAVSTSISVAASIIAVDGLCLATIKKLVPIFKFGTIVFAAAIIIIVTNEFGNDNYDKIKRRYLVEKQKRLLIKKYNETKYNINKAFKQLTDVLVDVMNNMVYNVLSCEEYFLKVNYSLLDIELSTESLAYDEIICIEQCANNIKTDFISVDSILNLL